MSEPVTIPGTQRQPVYSETGQEHQLLLARPAGDAPQGGYPVIYLLDANAHFGTAVEAVRLRCRRSDATGVPSAVVAGIGYPNVDTYDRQRRRFDFTFSAPADEPADHQGTGGAGIFAALLESAVKPIVERRFPIDRTRQVLFGHSLGGLFTLSLLMRHPGMFQAYIAASPSIWWDRRRLLEGADSLAGQSVKPAVMITVGEYEQKLAPWQEHTPKAEGIARRRAQRRMVDNARELAARLKAAGLRIDFCEFEAEDHASVASLALNRCLRFALGPS